MTFEETLRYLDRLGETRMRLDLDPSRRLLEILGRPDRGLKSVIVAGTNGKGSVCAFLTAAARAAGIRTGTYTSPHLISPLERIALDGAPVSAEIFSDAASRIRKKVEEADFGPTTYFEFLTMAAAVIFKEQKADLAIFEVGLGGRLDTTNALDRMATAITAIDYDHTAILGDTLTKIAAEKGAVMRKNLPAVIAPQHPEAEETLLQIGKETGARVIRSGETDLPLGLKGDHQKANAACAAAVARELGIADRFIREGLANARHPGRLERFQTEEGKEIWLDVGHNPAAAARTAEFFMKEKLAPIDIVIGVLGDKNWREILEILQPVSKTITVCKPNSPRAWEIAEVREQFPGVSAIEDPVEAFKSVLAKSSRVLCTGSFYTVGKIRALLV